MILKRFGWFPFFSSRNNNFSNRQQSGVICIGSNCTVNPATGVLQDISPAFSGTTSVSRSSASACIDTANTPGGANNNGAQSCKFSSNASAAPNNILSAETHTRTERDNDASGDGNRMGCAILSFGNSDDISKSEQQQIVIGVILLFVGVFGAWGGFYIYNRIRARRDAEPRFRNSTEWQGGKSTNFLGSGVQLFAFGGAAAGDAGVAAAGERLPRGAKDII